MPSLSVSAATAQIESGDTAPVYLLQGDDDVAKSALAGRIEEIVEEELRAFNVERIHAAEMTSAERIEEGVEAVLNAARTLPMMAPRRVVTVFQAENLLQPKR